MQKFAKIFVIIAYIFLNFRLNLMLSVCQISSTYVNVISIQLFVAKKEEEILVNFQGTCLGDDWVNVIQKFSCDLICKVVFVPLAFPSLNCLCTLIEFIFQCQRTYLISPDLLVWVLQDSTYIRSYCKCFALTEELRVSHSC